MSLEILGMGAALATTELDNDFLHEEVGLGKDPSWCESRLGIQKRYTCLNKEYLKQTKNADPNKAIELARQRGQTPVSLGVLAAEQALERAGVGPEKIGWVIASCDTPFDNVPNTATRIAQALGVGSGPHTDLNSACSSFALHAKFLADMREDRVPEFVLCVQTGCYTTRVDYSPRSVDGYILGDGASAQVFSTRHQGRLLVEPLIFESQPAQADQITLNMSAYFNQNGSAVRAFSIRKSCEMYEHVAEVKGLYAESVYTVGHQANLVMQRSIVQHLELPMERHLTNVREQGNIAAAGCPSVLSQKLDSLHKGDQIVYAVLGAGLAWGGGYMEAR